MKTVGSYEAKTHLASLLDEVASGESITITKHGVPVALMIPVQGDKANDRRAIVESWRKYRAENNIRLGATTIRELIEDGRQY